VAVSGHGRKLAEISGCLSMGRMTGLPLRPSVGTGCGGAMAGGAEQTPDVVQAVATAHGRGYRGGAVGFAGVATPGSGVTRR
jgi:hypothetical protein